MKLLNPSEFEIYTDLKSDYIFYILADFHFNNHFSLKDIIKLLLQIEDVNPDCVCLTGDNIDLLNFITNPMRWTLFQFFLEEISKRYQVAIIVDGHDFMYSNKDGKFIIYNDEKNNSILCEKSLGKGGGVLVEPNKSSYEYLSYVTDYESFLNSLDNTCYFEPFNNKVLDISEEYSLLGYSMNPGITFQTMNAKNSELYIDDFNKYVSCIPFTEDKNYGLLIHRPLEFLDDNGIKSDLGFDVSNINHGFHGHVHSYIIPRILRGFLNKAIISPGRGFTNKAHRGVVTSTEHDYTMVVNDSFIKCPATEETLYFANNFYGYEGNVVRLLSKKNR